MSDINKMDPELKSKWIEALRSGKYAQGRGQLRLESGSWPDSPGVERFCCLGVLCEVKGIPRNGEGYACTDPNSAFINYLPDSYLNPEAQRDLAHKNDTGFSFENIAAWIEENL